MITRHIDELTIEERRSIATYLRLAHLNGWDRSSCAYYDPDHGGVVVEAQNARFYIPVVGAAATGYGFCWYDGTEVEAGDRLWATATLNFLER